MGICLPGWNLHRNVGPLWFVFCDSQEVGLCRPVKVMSILIKLSVGNRPTSLNEKHLILPSINTMRNVKNMSLDVGMAVVGAKLFHFRSDLGLYDKQNAVWETWEMLEQPLKWSLLGNENRFITSQCLVFSGSTGKLNDDDFSLFNSRGDQEMGSKQSPIVGTIRVY